MGNNLEKKKIKDMFIKYLYIFVVSGIFGFIYETLFYKIDLGYFVKRGTTFGPWIPIYGFGAIFIAMLCSKIKDKPLLVFLYSAIITGIIEYITGFILLNFFELRLWDYNVEILNYGNINGFICLRSVLFFAVSGLLLMYLIIPFWEKLEKFKNSKIYIILTEILAILFILDIILKQIVLML